MKDQYHTIYNLSTTNSYNFHSEPKIYDKDDNSYTNLFINPSITNYSSFKPENKDYSINIFVENSKNFDSFEDSLSPLSSFPSSSASSTTSLPLTYSPPSPTQCPSSNDSDFCLNSRHYEPLSMIIPEPKKEEFSNPNSTKFFPKNNIILNSFTFYSPSKINRIWRYLITWSILLSLICYLVPFETEYTFITNIKYFLICLTAISLIFKIFIIFAQNNSFKSYVRSYTTSTSNDNNTSTPVHKETQQQQQEATVLSVDQTDQLTRNTRETQNENAAGFENPTLFGGCCNHCSCGDECSVRNNNCRYCMDYCLAGCLTACCLSTSSNG